MGTKIAEFFVEIGIIADIAKLSEVEKSFTNLHDMVSKNTKNLKKNISKFAKATKDTSKNTKQINKNLSPLNDKAKDIADSFGKTNFSVLAMRTALVGSYWVLDKLVKRGSQLSINMRNIGLQTGLNKEKLLEWSQVAQIANPNMDASQVLQTISAVQKGIADIRLGQGNARPYQLLGMSIVGQDAFGILEQLRKKSKEFQGDKRAWFTSLVQQMGVSQEMINVLRLSDVSFKKYKEMPKISKESQKELIKLRTKFKELNTELGYFGSSLLALSGPTLESFIGRIEKLTESGVKNIKLFKDGINAIMDLTKTFFDYLEPKIGKIAKELGLDSDRLVKKLSKLTQGKIQHTIFAPEVGFAQKMIQARKDLISQRETTKNIENNTTFHITGENNETLAHQIHGLLVSKANENANMQMNNGPRI